MEQGKVTKISYNKHFGSIILDDGREAIFNNNCLYRTASFNELVEGQEVEFYLQRSYKGYIAIEVRPRYEKEITKP